MDRISTAAFTKAGWYSNADSGTHTPKSEADGDYEGDKSNRERKGAEDAGAAAMGDDAGPGIESSRGPREEELPPPPPPLLTEKDLERSVYLTLHETETIFIWQATGVTVAMDTEEAKQVEEANRRYANLLHTKQATDKYVDAEAQTLVALKKTREAQSAMLVTRASGTQATAWDIADTFRALDEATADVEDDPRGGAVLPSISQLAGGVAKYTGSGGKAAGLPADPTSGRGTMAGASQSMMVRPSAYHGQSAAFGAQPSYMSGVGGNMSGLSGANLPNGVPMDQQQQQQQQVVPEVVNPLLSLRGLPDALALMDLAINQNNYLQQLLMYRDIQPLPGVRATVASTMRGTIGGGDDDATSEAASHAGRDNRPMSAVPSEGGRSHAESVAARSTYGGNRPSIANVAAATGQLSRQPSERSGFSRAMSIKGGRGGEDDARSVRQSHAGAGAGGGGGGGPGYAASVAESNWPEELLQELADLGDDAPRMEHLWDWSCPLTAGKNVACMGWNKANPDLLAVGYGSYAFGSGTPGAGAAGDPLSMTHKSSITGAAAASRPFTAESAATGEAGGAGAGATTTSGHQTTGHEPRGLVAFWSLKNLQHPLWWFEVKAAVTSLDFSTYSPNLLALGMYDGTVAIYDIKSRQGSPSMESDVHSGKHSDPVWKVKWLDHGPERDEPLVSISTDGRVTQWSIAKGLEFSDLMKLKRMARRGAGGPPTTSAAAAKEGSKAAAVPEQQDAFISRLTSGMAFDFSSRDERIYVAATEDGWLHKCSTSYSEQYLESYRGHMGPVYQVQFSPYKKDMFISASGDWTIRMWQEGRDTPLLTFQASTNEINDVQWCPTNSTVFGSVTASGRLEIWDFALSTVKPVMHQKTPAKLSCMLFAPNYPVVVCGGEDGTVKAYRLFNVSHEYDTLEEQLGRLDSVIKANVMKKETGQAGQA
ncbi:hypothetical protein HYH02_001816 [Chlamydomonas schloesseri]|uniref:Dynein axonemal intermediate chain 4 n=1 Tax=Chlamydomonas schloesseri TaxID=2026947 RepID=A0A835WSW7_9CHLO|nr:hypothetical protein HYH02_001816 [Chlamydomonas schloesseri]|eukprot:KAG2453598.1 hypothetical protein HYH02_001816 [Chlamydomonas schloesseri]